MNRMTCLSSYTFCTINNISISIKRSSFTLVFLKAASHANPGAERNFAGSNSHILRDIFRKFSNTSDNSNLSF